MQPEPEKRSEMRLAGLPLRGWVGLLLTLAFMAVILYAVPAVRWFFVLSIPPGLIVGLILYFLHRRQP